MKVREFDGETTEEADAIGEILLERLDVCMDAIHMGDEMVMVFDGRVRLVAMGTLDGTHGALHPMDSFEFAIKDDTIAIPASLYVVLVAQMVVDFYMRYPLLTDFASHAS